MRRWRAKDVIDLAKQNAELVATALERAQNDKDGGLADNRRLAGDDREDGTKGRKSGVSRPVEDRALRGGGDKVRREVERLIRYLEKTHGVLTYLSGIDAKEAAKALESGAYCCNPHCGRWVSNTKNDRLRSGRCNRCRMWRLRHAGEDWTRAQGTSEESQPA